MKIHFGKPKPTGTIAEAVPHYGSREFESPTRSTIPLLSLLAHAPDVFDGIVGKLGFSGQYDLYLEYTVSPRKGRGKASHTDVMLKSGTSALAIEAKWTEPMYETGKKWRGLEVAAPDGRPSNKSLVLDGWLELLQTRTPRKLLAPEFDTAIYQMVHRAASAAEAGDNSRLAYFVFKPSPDRRAATGDAIFDKLGNLWKRLGKPDAFPFYVVEIEARPTEAYELLRPLPKSKGSTAEAVIAALQDAKPLFSFTAGEPRLVGA